MKPDPHVPTLLSSKVCNPGLPVEGYKSKFLLRHAFHGWMLGWWMPLSDTKGFFGCVTMTETTRRDPLVVKIDDLERQCILEWLPLPIIDVAPLPKAAKMEDAEADAITPAEPPTVN